MRLWSALWQRDGWQFDTNASEYFAATVFMVTELSPSKILT